MRLRQRMILNNFSEKKLSNLKYFALKLIFASAMKLKIKTLFKLDH